MFLGGDVGIRLIFVLRYINGLRFQLEIAQLFLSDTCCSDFVTGDRRNVEWGHGLLTRHMSRSIVGCDMI